MTTNEKKFTFTAIIVFALLVLTIVIQRSNYTQLEEQLMYSRISNDSLQREASTPIWQFTIESKFKEVVYIKANDKFDAQRILESQYVSYTSYTDNGRIDILSSVAQTEE